MKKTFIYFLTTLFLLINVTVTATNYYVKPLGNDANTGLSNAQAFKTIQKALNVCQPGDNIIVRGGVYKERLEWKTSGLSTLPITLTAYSEFAYYGGRGNYASKEEPYWEKVYLDGDGTIPPRISQKEMIRIRNKSYIRINAILIVNSYLSDATGIFISGKGNDVQITNCKVHNIGWTSNFSLGASSASLHNAYGIRVFGDSATPYQNILISKNEIDSCNTGYSEGISINGNIDSFEISGNKVHDITNIGIDLIGHENRAAPGIDQARHGNVINNTVYRCVSPIATSAGIYVDGGKWITIERNRAYENGYGIEVGCENAGKTAEGIIVRNNLIYNNKKTGLSVGGYGANSWVLNTIVTGNTFYKNNSTLQSGAGEISFLRNDGLTIKNNIIHSRTNIALVALNGFTSINLAFDYNLYFTLSETANNIEFDWHNIGLADYSSLSSFIIGTGLDMHSIYENPDFIDGVLPAPNLHLTDTSEAINAGTPVYIVQSGELDIDGWIRLNNVRIDIGADETDFATRMANPITMVPSPTVSPVTLSIYPNPASSDKLTVFFPAVRKQKTAVLYNENGNILLTQNLTHAITHINIAALRLRKQVLLLKVITEKETVTQKVIIK